MLNADSLLAVQNPENALDVNADEDVTPQDALIIANELDGTGEAEAIGAGELPLMYYDVDGDGSLTEEDFDAVAAYLNGQTDESGNASYSFAEGEMSGSGSGSGGNSVPVVSEDAYSSTPNATLTVSDFSSGVLGNDNDYDGDTMTAHLVDDVTSGTLQFMSDGTFAYTPVSNWAGQDSFTYYATDGSLNSEITTVTIDVCNSVPWANDDWYYVQHDHLLSEFAPGILINDYDYDGDPLSVTLFSGVSNGTLTLEADGSFEYTPDSGFTGSDSFIYEISDGFDTVQATATIEVVNASPIANDNYIWVEHETWNTPILDDVLGDDFDADGDTLSAIIVTAASHGILRSSDGSPLVPGSEFSGSFEYIPNSTWPGADSFSYKAFDQLRTSDEAMVSINLNPGVSCRLIGNPTATQTRETWLTNGDGYADSYAESEIAFAVLAEAPNYVLSPGQPAETRRAVVKAHGEDTGIQPLFPGAQIPFYQQPDSWWVSSEARDIWLFEPTNSLNADGNDSTHDLVHHEFALWEIDGVAHDLEKKNVRTYQQSIKCVAAGNTPLEDVFDAAENVGILGDRLTEFETELSETSDVYEFEADSPGAFTFVGPALVNLPELLLKAEYVKADGDAIATLRAWEEKFRVSKDGLPVSPVYATPDLAIQKVRDAVGSRIGSLITANGNIETAVRFR